MHSPLLSPFHSKAQLSDGYRCACRYWTPADRVRDVGILYLHGIQSHGGWYEWSASVLASTGRFVTMPDRRGSGRNRVARGDTPNVQRLLRDLDDIVGEARLAFGIKRWGIVGVSWGGKLALAWLQRRPELVSQLLLIAPGIMPRVGMNPVKQALVGACLLLGPKQEFRIPLDSPALFTESPGGQQFIADDPIKLQRATARFLYASRQLDRRMRRFKRNPIPVPVTAFLGEKDLIIRNDRTARWLKRVCVQPPRIVHVPLAGHTIEFEEDREGFRDALVAWARTLGNETRAEMSPTPVSVG